MTSSRTLTDSLRKPVAALAMQPRTGRITVTGRKAWNVLLAIAQKKGFENEIYRALLADVVTGIDFTSNDQRVVKDHLRSMVSTTVEWQSPTAGEGFTWTVSGMLAHARLIKERGAIWVEWSYAVAMRHEMVDPEVFARISLSYMTQLSTHAAVALYEIGTRYKEIGKTARNNWRWWVPTLTGRPSDDRTARLEYRIFKRDVIRSAVAEVNKHTDIEVELIEFKEGRHVEEIRFDVRKKVMPSKEAGAPAPVDVAILVRAENLGIDHDKVERLVREMGPDVVTVALDAVENRMENQYPEPIRDSYRYLKSVLPDIAASAGGRDTAEAGSGKSPEAAMLARDGRRDDWARQWVSNRTREIKEEITALPIARQEELTNSLYLELESQGAHKAILGKLKTKGWMHEMVSGRMVQFYANAKYGESWNQPTAEQVLEVAATSAILEAK